MAATCTLMPACQNASDELRNSSSPGSPTPAWPNATDPRAVLGRGVGHLPVQPLPRAAELVELGTAPERGGIGEVGGLGALGLDRRAARAPPRCPWLSPTRSERMASDARRDARASSRCSPARTRSASISAASRPSAVPASTRARTAASRASRSPTSASYSAARFWKRKAE